MKHLTLKLSSSLLLALLVFANAEATNCEQLQVIEQKQGDIAMTEKQLTLEEFNRPELMLSEKTRFNHESFLKHTVVQPSANPLENLLSKKPAGTIQTFQFTRPDGVVVIQERDGDKCVERLVMSESPFEYFAVYDKNGVLISKYSSFFGTVVGDELLFNPNGSLRERKPLNPEHLISIEQLRGIVKQELGKDIYNKNDTFRITLRNSGEPSKPYYTVQLYRTDPSSNELEIYLVDGQKGKLLYNISSKYYGLDAPRGKDKPKNFWDEYQNHLKELGQQGMKDE